MLLAAGVFSADALMLPTPTFANARASSARAPVARMDEVAAATAQLADLQAQLAKLEELKQLEAQLRQMQAAAPPAAVTPPPAAVVPPPPVAVTPPPLPVQPPPAITTPPPAAVTPPPEVVAPPPVPMPAPAPEAAAAAAQSSGFQMPQMQMPSLPQMPATPMPEPYQIPSDSMNPLLVDVAVVAAVPLLAYGIASCWDVLKGPEDDSAVPPQPWEANFGMPAGSGDRSAPDIFLGGVENLAKEPLGWLSGEPSPLNSYNGAGNPGAAPAGGAPRPMGGTPSAQPPLPMGPPPGMGAPQPGMTGRVAPTAPPMGAPPMGAPPMGAPPMPMGAPPVPMGPPPMPSQPAASAPPMGGMTATMPPPTMTAPDALEPAQRMAELKALLEDGLIDENEFEQAKRAILESI